MTKPRIVSFAGFRRLLKDVGFSAKRTESAWVFHHPTEGIIAVRLYGEAEPVEERDLASTRKFLDLRGILDAKDFESLLQETTPA